MFHSILTTYEVIDNKILVIVSIFIVIHKNASKSRQNLLKVIKIALM